MTLSFIPPAMSVTGAVIFIIFLLLVAAAIGIVTTWFYARSVYTPVINKLEGEKADLQREVSGLKEDVRRLERDIDGFKTKIAELEKDLSEREKKIKELQKKAKDSSLRSE